jgi:hypothetical protein
MTREVEDAAKESLFGGRADGRVALGIPDPVRALQPAGGFLAAVQADPTAHPVLGFEQAHRPAGRRAPRGWRALTVPALGEAMAGQPDAHFPVALGLRRQWLAGIFHLDALVGDALAAVPEIRLILGELVRGRGDQNLIGGLSLTALGGFDDPTQARLRHVDAQRIGKIFAAEVGEVGGRGEREVWQDRQGDEEEDREATGEVVLHDNPQFSKWV